MHTTQHETRTQNEKVCAGAANGVSSAVFRVLSDEYGGGRPLKRHAAFYRAALLELGLDAREEAYLDLVPWEVRRWGAVRGGMVQRGGEREGEGRKGARKNVGGGERGPLLLKHAQHTQRNAALSPFQSNTYPS